MVHQTAHEVPPILSHRHRFTIQSPYGIRVARAAEDTHPPALISSAATHLGRPGTRLVAAARVPRLASPNRARSWVSAASMPSHLPDNTCLPHTGPARSRPLPESR